ncbi:PREDICTED: uncharacterized protein LOC105127194 isoform X1 [Populus euphratica]|uniref:Uncharacterized protein LOC105127194 isoform X1 n=1 Tax=Populus euphratica TaxID=75702 RepID=A0AAJ6UCE6_POPEU|nr:PREDICTED: uncharacterized protein LOC105127194 isoform X1 [Populus euphratica]XP_011026677.1 PREDICTED: uncharacterized protein LOC105127194 isoform X1 [Populus euphratica]
MKMTYGLLDDMVLHYPPRQHDSTEEANMLTVPQNMLAQPGVPQHGINISVSTPEDRKEKKRKIDADYRQRCKIRKEELGINLQILREENANLKRENESCRKENDSMVQKLQSQEVEIGNLKREIDNSKKVISNQENLLETLSHNPFVQQLTLGPNQLEMVLIENERNMLCQNAKWDNWASERIQLLNEIEKMGQRNMVLNMQNQALGD